MRDPPRPVERKAQPAFVEIHDLAETDPSWRLLRRPATAHSRSGRCGRAISGVSCSWCMKYWLRVGVHVSASASEVSSETPTVIARARKNTPVTPVIAIRGTKTTMGVMVENTSGTRDFLQRAANGLQPALASVAVQRDVLDHHDGIVDHQSHGRRQSAQSHQVETLAQQLEGDERDQHGRPGSPAPRRSTCPSRAGTAP